jgi:hypothetical protein
MSISSMRAVFHKLTPGQQGTLKVVLGAALGGALGFAYYALVGCATGACPLASNPVITTGMGTLVGGMMARG